MNWKDGKGGERYDRANEYLCIFGCSYNAQKYFVELCIYSHGKQNDNEVQSKVRFVEVKTNYIRL